MILIVDDEEAVRSVTKRILESNGYRTLAATRGTEAVACYVEKGDEISVVLTDLHMPDMGGAEAIAVLREINPSVRIIVATGAGSPPGAPNAHEMGVQAYIKKPFDLAHLLVTLQQVLQLKDTPMKTYLAVGAILTRDLNGLLLVPATSGHTQFRSPLWRLVLALLILALSLHERPKSEDNEPSPVPDCRSGSRACYNPASAPGRESSRSGGSGFLRASPGKGSACRFSHGGYRSLRRRRSRRRCAGDSSGVPEVLQEYFKISAISDAQEGSQVTVPVGYATEQYRIVGKLTESRPSQEHLSTRAGRPNS